MHSVETTGLKWASPVPVVGQDAEGASGSSSSSSGSDDGGKHSKVRRRDGEHGRGGSVAKRREAALSNATRALPRQQVGRALHSFEAPVLAVSLKSVCLGAGEFVE